MMVILLIFSTFHSATGQDISSREIASAVQTMSKLIEEKYVFAEKGKAISKHLKREFNNGKFRDVKSWKALETMATAVLREFSNDGHLYVNYDPKTVKELTELKVEETEEKFSYDPFYYGEEAMEKNFGFKEVKILEDNIGYLKLSEINISEKSLPVLYAAMQFIAHTEAMIIDLQDNHGGGSAIGSVLESYFLPKETPLLDFKSRDGGNNLSTTVSWLTEKKYNKPLFILINRGTASAAEAFSFALQANKRAVVVGQPSAGAAHMNSWYPVNDNIFISISTGAPTLPGTEITWERKGIEPDHLVETGKEIVIIQKLLAGKNKATQSSKY